MSRSPEKFARILTEAIKTIATHEHKHIHVIHDELGYALGKRSGASLERWRKGYLPAKAGDVETLARTLVERRGIRDANTLKQFLLSADYAPLQPLLEELDPWLTQKANVTLMPGITQTDPASPNPFIIGLPLTHPRHFFGRGEALERIFGVWQQPPLQNVAVIGLKRSGKTSLLHYLRHITQTPPDQLRPGQRHDWLSQPERYRWVFVDFQDPRMGSRERLLNYLLAQLNLRVPPGCDLHTFMDIVSEDLADPAIILLDEMGIGLESPELDRQFWRSLRSLGANASGGNLAFLLTAHESPAKLAQEKSKSSPFFTIFGHTLELGPLTEAEAREVVVSSPKPFAGEDVEWILSQSGYWPCLLQALCHVRLATLAKGQGEAWQAEALRQIEPYRYLLGK